jgi:SpoVK/Ycf46/Vps4 family AAA+-type ATPase
MQLPVGLLARLVREDGDAPIQPVVALLRNVLGLTCAETRLLDFLDNRQSVGTFGTFIRLNKGCDSEANFQRMAALLDITVADIRQVLDKKSVLSELRLIEVSGRGFNDLDHFVTSSDGLKEMFLAAPASEEALRDLLIESAPAPEWALDDFPHLANSAATIKQVLGHAARNGETGVNALFIGPPGTGKSEFAYALAAATGLHLYRIRSDDNDGEGVGRRGRLVAYLLAQRLLQRRRDALILFDEVEDVFDGDDASSLRLLLGGKRRAGQEKGWMNRLLEENRVPAIWITNDADIMDPAFLRRFLLPVEFCIPPRGVRRAMAERHLGDCGLPPALLDELAADDKLAPAQLGAARRLLTLHAAQNDAVAGSQVVRDGVSAMRRLLHGSGLPPVRRSATTFDMAFLNIGGGIAPQRIVDALARRGRGNLCLYGPPGTGKTEFAHVLADLLERELVVKQTSDLVSKYVGETEQNIAALFNNLDAERTVLFIDEVDSFLRDRRQAQRSWEVTEVNELLQHMERFPGIFIAATNLVEGIDPATLRRFDFKLHFQALTPQQRVAMFAQETLGHMGRYDELSPAIMKRLSALDQLTAGDFANVCRQRDLLGEELSAEDFLRRLIQECRWKIAAAA